MNLIAIDTGDGVAVMTINPNGDQTDTAVAYEIERSGFADMPWVRIDPKDVPQDRSKRANWRLRNGKIVVEQ